MAVRGFRRCLQWIFKGPRNESVSSTHCYTEQTSRTSLNPRLGQYFMVTFYVTRTSQATWAVFKVYPLMMRSGTILPYTAQISWGLSQSDWSLAGISTILWGLSHLNPRFIDILFPMNSSISRWISQPNETSMVSILFPSSPIFSHSKTSIDRWFSHENLQWLLDFPRRSQLFEPEAPEGPCVDGCQEASEEAQTVAKEATSKCLDGNFSRWVSRWFMVIYH